jgi:hypothetical protein
MHQFIGFVLLQSVFIFAIFVSLCDICKRAFRLDDFLAFCAGTLAVGALGYASFWVAYVNYPTFGGIKIIVLASLIVFLAHAIYHRSFSLGAGLTEPLLYTFLFFLIVITLGMSNGGFENPTSTAQIRFSHPLPIDNIAPLIFAQAIQNGFVPSPLDDNWLSSDRPPLQVGLYFLLCLRNTRYISPSELAGSPFGYFVVTVCLQATYLFGVWGVAAAAAVPTATRRLILLASCLLPTAIINTLFTWPKMIAVGYLLLVFALLFCRRAESERDRKATGILIGGLTALSLLSHGSSLFALIGFAVVVAAFWHWPPLKSVIYGAGTLFTLYTPWVLYQTFIDPPGNRLFKWHFAGVVDVDGRSSLAALRDSFGTLSWHDYLQGRLANFIRLWGVWPDTIWDRVIGPFSSWYPPQHVRGTDFFSFLPSLHTFGFALMIAPLLLPFVPPPQRGIGLRLLVALAATLSAFVILIFDPSNTVNHHGTYTTQVMATVFVFLVLGLCARWLALLFIAAQTVTVAAAYVFSIEHNPALFPFMAICAAAILLLYGHSLSPTVSGLMPIALIRGSQHSGGQPGAADPRRQGPGGDAAADGQRK